MVQGALALDATSSDPAHGILRGDTALVVMCQHHGTFQLTAGSIDGIGGIAGLEVMARQPPLHQASLVIKSEHGWGLIP